MLGHLPGDGFGIKWSARVSHALAHPVKSFLYQLLYRLFCEPAVSLLWPANIERPFDSVPNTPKEPLGPKIVPA